MKKFLKKMGHNKVFIFGFILVLLCSGIWGNFKLDNYILNVVINILRTIGTIIGLLLVGYSVDLENGKK